MELHDGPSSFQRFQVAGAMSSWRRSRWPRFSAPQARLDIKAFMFPTSTLQGYYALSIWFLSLFSDLGMFNFQERGLFLPATTTPISLEKSILKTFVGSKEMT